MRRLPAAALVGLVALFFASGSAHPSTPALVAHPCLEGKSRAPSICGALRVYENRAAHAGRTIEIHFVLVEARHRTGHVIYWNPGGPGAPAVTYAGYAADGELEKPLAALHDRYDILLVDNRGMGLSHPLDCSSIYDQAHPAAYYLQLWPSAALRACRARDALTSDLSEYTTDNAVDDLNDLRAALGYRKIVLDGGSYGTYTSFIYMRRHPESVESAVLDGVAPPRLLILPLEDAYGSQLAMEDVIRECATDAACHAHFPLLAQHFAAFVARFEHGPIPIVIRNGATHKLERVLLSKEVFTDRLRQALYSAEGAAYVPITIEQAYRGNDIALGALIDNSVIGIARIVDTGANLSYACAEQLPFITEAMVARTSAHSFEGDLRVRAEQEACRIWNVRALPESENAIVSTSLPALMVSGTNDPTSPAIYARRELPYLRNGALVLQRGASHEDTSDCAAKLIVRFVLAHSTHGLNTASCASFHLPPFVFSVSRAQNG